MTLAIVTGSNRGVGLELCRRLVTRGGTVLAACRSSSSQLDALGVEVLPDVDVSSDAGVEKLAQAVAGRSVNLLINNAGILAHEELGALDVESIRKQFEVNALGPLRITAALAPRLVSGAKIALITSRMGSVADNGSGGYYGYRMSKAALNMAGASMARNRW